MKRLVLVLCLFWGLLPLLRGQERGHVGVSASPSESGLVLDWITREDRTGGYKFMVSVSYWDLMTGGSRLPAFYARLLYDLPVWTWPLPGGGQVQVWAGTGATLGVGSNFTLPEGPVFAVAAEAGAGVDFRAPITLRLLWHADLGMHIHPVTAYNTTVRFYRPGVWHAYLPSLEVLWRF